MRIVSRRQSRRNNETIINDAPRTFTDADWPVGSVSFQGDLIFIRLASLPTSSTTEAGRQLAEGNTQGSRHVLSTGNVYRCAAELVTSSIAQVCKGVVVGEQYVGPVIQTVDGVADVIHPEHGDHFYRGDMVIACVYQRNLDAEQREQRTKD